MPKKHKCPECPPAGLPGWFATFSDMQTLLVVFFVLLISMSSIESAKFAQAMASLRGALGVMNATLGNTIAVTNMPVFNIGRGRTENIIEAQMEHIIEQLQIIEMLEMLKTHKSRDFLHITIYEPLMFASGEANMRAQANPIFESLAKILAAFD